MNHSGLTPICTNLAFFENKVIDFFVNPPFQKQT
jgi:hypothetical protein